MKIAHLILAHKNAAQIEQLINALQHPDFYFFIHVDQKCDLRPFLKLSKLNHVNFVNERVKIFWGDWGTVQATINGFKEIIPGGFDYINVISGQDFPIKSARHIYNFFEKEKNHEFITCDPLEGEWSGSRSRVENYHLINWRFPGRFRLSRILTRILPKRKFPLDYEIVGRSSWFALTRNAAEYSVRFLESNPQFVKYFKLCWGADEYVFSTILYNSKFRPMIKENFVYVDWSGEEVGHSRILDIPDFEKLHQSDKLFARKFDITKNIDVLAKMRDQFWELEN